MNDIEVSVICTAYNQRNYIEKCIRGMIRQKTNFKFEILIHDDASVDGTAEIIRKYQKKYPNLIKAILQEENQYSKNPHIEDHIYPFIRGRFLAFCEGDDYWCDERKLQKQYDEMTAHPECTLCVHNVRRIKADGTLTKNIITSSVFKPGLVDGDKFIKSIMMSSKEGLFQTSSYFVKQEIFLKMPEFRKVYSVGDVPLMLWAATNGSIFFMNDISSCYRVMSPGSTNRALRCREYAIMRIQTSVDGHLAFNEETGHKYWGYMKHDIRYKQAQLYFVDKSKFSKAEKQKIFKELSKKEIVTAWLKFTKVGNILRNMKQMLQNRYV